MISKDMPPAAPGFEHKFGFSDGLRLHYVDGGAPEKPPLVLLAGFPESWEAWRKAMPSLAAGFHVVAIDLPGQGDSERPLDGFDTATVARRVHGLVKAIGLESYFLAAHDVGAWVAFPYALLFGEEIKALTLMDAGIPGVSLPEMTPTYSGAAWKTWHFAFHTVADLPEALIEGRERAYIEWFLRAKTANPESYSEADVAEYLRTYAAPGGLSAGLGFYRALARSAAQNQELSKDRKLTMPVLGLSADRGSILDMAASLRPFAVDVLSARIENCGHFQPHEQPEAVAKALTEFFIRQ